MISEQETPIGDLLSELGSSFLLDVLFQRSVLQTTLLKKLWLASILSALFFFSS